MKNLVQKKVTLMQIAVIALCYIMMVFSVATAVKSTNGNNAILGVTSVTAFATGKDTSGDSTSGDSSSLGEGDKGAFDGLSTSVVDIINQAKRTVMSFAVPLGGLAITVAIVIKYLPGVDPRTKGMAGNVIWGVIGGLFLLAGLDKILDVVVSLGGNIK